MRGRKSAQLEAASAKLAPERVQLAMVTVDVEKMWEHLRPATVHLAIPSLQLTMVTVQQGTETVQLAMAVAHDAGMTVHLAMVTVPLAMVMVHMTMVTVHVTMAAAHDARMTVHMPMVAAHDAQMTGHRRLATNQITIAADDIVRRSYAARRASRPRTHFSDARGR
jgi:hypothetical protein